MTKNLWWLRYSLKDLLRDSSALAIYVASITLAVAGLVCGLHISNQLNASINGQGQALLGADIEISSRTQVPDELISWLKKDYAAEISHEIRTRSVLKKTTGGVILVQIRGIQENFPLYGKITSDTSNDEHHIQDYQVLVDSSLKNQIDNSAFSHLSETPLKNDYFKLAPGGGGFATLFAPQVLIPLKIIKESKLLNTGSVADYVVYLKLKQNLSLTSREIEEKFPEYIFDFTTAAEKETLLGRFANSARRFIAIATALCFLLGLVGILQNVQIHLAAYLPRLATLRCLGATPDQTILILATQLLFATSLASAIGALFGSALGSWLAYELTTLLRLINQVPLTNALYFGLFAGPLSCLAALFPTIRKLKKLSAREALRPSSEEISLKFPKLETAISILFPMIGIIFILSSDRRVLIILSLLLIIFALAGVIVKTILFILAKYSADKRFSFLPLKLALVSATRAGNRTFTISLAIISVFSLAATGIISAKLLDSLTDKARGKTRPDLFLFDVQIDQKEHLKRRIKDLNARVLQETPVILMRLTALNQRPINEILADKESGIPRWTLTREYWSTYRANNLENEDVVAGEWIKEAQKDVKYLPVSIEDRLLERLKLKLGDILSFEILGTPYQAKITSARKIYWERLERNSFLVFPEGVLSDVPQYFFLAIKNSSNQLQETLRDEFPGISVLPLQSIIDAVEGLESQITKGAYILIILITLSSILVLIAVLISARILRRRERDQLWMLGMTPLNISFYAICEVLLIAAIALFAGWLASIAVGSALAIYVFKTSFIIPFFELAWLTIAVVATILLISGAILVSERRSASLIRM
jgi:putative ABC transport system permease protein